MGDIDFAHGFERFGPKTKGRLLRFVKACSPGTFKGAFTAIVVTALVVWMGVTFYHGWNQGAFHYNDADLAVNIDCKNGSASSLAQEMCKRAKIRRGVHPFIYAMEYTLITSRDSVVSTFLAVVGSSILMIAVFALVAFCLALWYIKPSSRESTVMIPSIFQGCTHEMAPRRSSFAQNHYGEGIDEILLPFAKSAEEDNRLNDNVNYGLAAHNKRE